MPREAITNKPLVCDVCGAPATMYAVELYRHEMPGATYPMFSPKGAVKYGCPEHPVISVEFPTDKPPMVNKTRCLIGILLFCSLFGSACDSDRPAPGRVFENRYIYLRDARGECLALDTKINVVGNQFAQYGHLNVYVTDSAKCGF